MIRASCVPREARFVKDEAHEGGTLMTNRWPMIFALVIAGCAGDPNKEAKDARKAQEQAMRENEAKRLELERKYAEEQAQLRGELRQDLQAQEKRVQAAEQRSTDERKTFQSKTEERLQKIDARATEIQGKLENSRPSVQNAVKQDWRAFRENRGKVGSKMNEVKGAGEETWRSATYEIESNLDSLEDTLDRVAKKL
jgi:hypothetical protein